MAVYLGGPRRTCMTTGKGVEVPEYEPTQGYKRISRRAKAHLHIGDVTVQDARHDRRTWGTHTYTHKHTHKHTNTHIHTQAHTQAHKHAHKP